MGCERCQRESLAISEETDGSRKSCDLCGSELTSSGGLVSTSRYPATDSDRSEGCDRWDAPQRGAESHLDGETWRDTYRRPSIDSSLRPESTRRLDLPTTQQRGGGPGRRDQHPDAFGVSQRSNQGASLRRDGELPTNLPRHQSGQHGQDRAYFHPAHLRISPRSRMAPDHATAWWAYFGGTNILFCGSVLLLAAWWLHAGTHQSTILPRIGIPLLALGQIVVNMALGYFVYRLQRNSNKIAATVQTIDYGLRELRATDREEPAPTRLAWDRDPIDTQPGAQHRTGCRGDVPFAPSADRSTALPPHDDDPATGMTLSEIWKQV